MMMLIIMIIIKGYHEVPCCFNPMHWLSVKRDRRLSPLANSTAVLFEALIAILQYRSQCSTPEETGVCLPDEKQWTAGRSYESCRPRTVHRYSTWWEGEGMPSTYRLNSTGERSPPWDHVVRRSAVSHLLSSCRTRTCFLY
jgi:hypothetical protein